MSGVAISASKAVQFSFWIFSTISSPPTKSAPASLRFLLAVARGDHGHGLGLAQPVRQNHGAAHHLVGMARIDTQAHGQIDCLIKLGVLDLLEQAHGFGQRIRRLGHSRARLHNILADFCHSSLVSHRSCQPRFAGSPAQTGNQRNVARSGQELKSRGDSDSPEDTSGHIYES